MIQIGTVKGYEVKTNRDGSKLATMLQVQFTCPEDVQTVELMQSAGEDSNPATGSKVAVLSAGPAWKIAIAVDDGIEPGMLPGEKRLYSIDDAGAAQAVIRMLVDGVIELNGNADYAVRYNQLETAFNQLKSDFDDLVTLFNDHTHLYLPGPGSETPTAAPATTGTASTADITQAKVDTVKLPAYEGE